jgi:hypothetical protein
MLLISRDKLTGRALFSTAAADATPPPEVSKHMQVHAHVRPPLVLVPRCPVVPGHVRFAAWCELHTYYLDCMFGYLKGHLESTVALSWEALRNDLARYAYETSANRHRGFNLLK